MLTVMELIVAIEAVVIIVLWWRHEVLSRRVTIAETKLESAPTEADIAEMRSEYTTIRSELAVLRERTETTSGQVADIHRYLLEGHR